MTGPHTGGRTGRVPGVSRATSHHPFCHVAPSRPVLRTVRRAAPGLLPPQTAQLRRPTGPPESPAHAPCPSRAACPAADTLRPQAKPVPPRCSLVLGMWREGSCGHRAGPAPSLHGVADRTAAIFMVHSRRCWCGPGGGPGLRATQRFALALGRDSCRHRAGLQEARMLRSGR